MNQKLKNPDYDCDFLLNEVALESPLFKANLLSLLKDIDQDNQTDEIWMGTLNVEGKETQVKLVITQEPKNFIDENS